MTAAAAAIAETTLLRRVLQTLAHRVVHDLKERRLMSNQLAEVGFNPLQPSPQGHCFFLLLPPSSLALLPNAELTVLS